MRTRSVAIALLVILCLGGCFGAAGETEDSYDVPVRILDARGLEWPRDAANGLRYALAVVPGAIFGVADRTSLRQIGVSKAQLELDMVDLAAWARKSAKPWQVGEGLPVTVKPADTQVARVMLAAFQGEGGSSYGVGFHDLGLRRNLVLLYVDRACTIESADDGAAASVDYALDLPAAGFYWVRTAPGETIEGVDPDTLTVELRMRGG